MVVRVVRVVTVVRARPCQHHMHGHTHTHTHTHTQGLRRLCNAIGITQYWLPTVSCKAVTLPHWTWQVSLQQTAHSKAGFYSNSHKQLTAATHLAEQILDTAAHRRRVVYVYVVVLTADGLFHEGLVNPSQLAIGLRALTTSPQLQALCKTFAKARSWTSGSTSRS